MTPVKVLYAAAHSGFNLGRVPLGGGASICDHLTREWTRTRPFNLEILGPSLLKEAAPQDKDLVQYSELEYARFCRRFERALTERIVREDPLSSVILCNDVSEGPDFKSLAARGFSLFTIYHVDVVDYFTSIYLHSCAKPETTTAFYRGIRRIGLSGFLPGMLRLIWEKQEASVRYSKGLIVPSERMKEVLVRCYPWLEASRVHVLPWGMWEDAVSSLEITLEKEKLQKEHTIQPGAYKLLTLSRISPEKGQDRLLNALALWERQPDFPKEGLLLFIAGESAYMMGQRYARKLTALAARLKRCHIHFVGHAAGARKKALFELADLYVFPSRHESYGLTLLEALREGKPVLATPSHGAREVFRPGFGEMITPGPENTVPERLLEGLRRLLSDRTSLARMGQVARDWALEQRFSDTAAKVGELLLRR